VVKTACGRARRAPSPGCGRLVGADPHVGPCRRDRELVQAPALVVVADACAVRCV